MYDDSDSRHNVQLQENGDLAVVLKRGQSGITTDNVPCNVDDTGLVVVSLGVDGGEHDAVHYSSHGGCEAEEVLGQAIDALLVFIVPAAQVRRGWPVRATWRPDWVPVARVRRGPP